MAVKKDAAFYRKQRERDKALAAKGDSKAKKELAAIEAKRVRQRGTNKPKSNGNGKPESAAAQVGRAVATSTPGGKAISAVKKWQAGQDVKQAQSTRGAMSAIGKALSNKGSYSTTAGTTGTYNPQPVKKNGNGNGSKPATAVKTPRIRAYSSLSGGEKFAENRRNVQETGLPWDAPAKKSSNGK